MLKHLLAGAAALVVATAANAETYAIQAGHLIVDAAQAERGPSTVIVENGRIAGSRPALQRRREPSWSTSAAARCFPE